MSPSQLQLLASASYFVAATLFLLGLQRMASPRTAEGEVDATIEIMPLTAIEACDLADAKLPDRIDPHAEVLL